MVLAILVKSESNINLDKLVSDLTTDSVLKVGWVKGNRYPKEQGGKYVAEIAAQNEYGAPHKAIPARPFMAPAVAQNKTKWTGLAAKGAAKAANGDITMPDVLESLGDEAANDITKAIKAVTSPALSQVTIANRLARYTSKGNKKKINPTTLTKPLVDTSLMIDSVYSTVEPE